MIMKKLICLFALGGLILGSCSSDPELSNPPVINITAPNANQSYDAGSVIEISGLATDDVGVTDISFVAGGDPQALDLSTATDVTSIPFSISLSIDSATEAGDYEVEITATDADGQMESDILAFSVN